MTTDNKFEHWKISKLDTRYSQKKKSIHVKKKSPSNKKSQKREQTTSILTFLLFLVAQLRLLVFSTVLTIWIKAMMKFEK
jgi:hypothetical protein